MKITEIDYLSAGADQEFVHSICNTGFAVLKNHPIPKKLINLVYEEWARFFESNNKYEYLYSKEEQAGYFPFRSENAKDSSVKDLKEFFHLFPKTSLPNGFSSRTFQIRDQLTEMGVELLKWLQKFSPSDLAEKYSLPLNEMISNSSGTLLRVLHYPPINAEDGLTAVRAAAHEDINLITLLPAATAPGLQVKDHNDMWHDVSCDPGNIVVNAGDMLQLASNGYFKSTTHRVINPRGKEALRSRYSMPLFLHPRREVKLSVGFTAKDYLETRLKEIGLLT